MADMERRCRSGGCGLVLCPVIFEILNTSGGGVDIRRGRLARLGEWEMSRWLCVAPTEGDRETGRGADALVLRRCAQAASAF